MALLWLDGFEGYAPGGAGTLAQGYRLGIGGGAAVNATAGRASGAALVGMVRIGLPANTTTVIIGYAWKGAIASGGGQLLLVSRLADGGLRSLFQFNITSLNSVTGVVAPEAGSPGVIFPETPIEARLDNVWRYIEHTFHIHGSTGAYLADYTLRIDEVEQISVANVAVPVSPLAATAISYLEIKGDLIDDVYVCDDTGATHNDFLGDLRLSPLFAVADVSANWTPDSGTDNFAMVNETATNVATGVETDVLDTEDEYEYQDTGFDPAQPIVAMAVMTVAERLSDSGPRGLTSFANFSGTRAEGAFHQLSDSPYIEQLRVMVHPLTSDPLVASDIDAVTAGHRLTL